jgi:DNA-binding beta-propeller fold protein YncE
MHSFIDPDRWLPVGARAVLPVLFILQLTACTGIDIKLQQVPKQSPLSVTLSQWSEIRGGVEGDRYTGIAPVNLVRPVAVAARGNDVYIVDMGVDRLYLFDNVTGNLSILKDLREIVTGEVSDIFVAADRSFYLADVDGRRVLHFDRQGSFIREFKDDINLGRPMSVIEDAASGWVYIADGFNDDILVYNGAGQLQGAIGTRGDDEGQFRGITAMTGGDEGLYVATRFGPSRVQLMGYDRSFKYAFDQDTLVFPTALTRDTQGRVYASDFSYNTIQVFAEGHVVATYGGTGSGPGRFKHITDLWFDNGLLYVADSLNSRIQVIRVTNGQ